MSNIPETAPAEMTQKIRQYFEIQGRDGYVNGRRARVIYNGHNTVKKMVMRNSEHQFAIGDKIQLDTATYIVKSAGPSKLNPYLNEAIVTLQF